MLEVRSRDVPFILEDGQIVGRLVYERMAERPKVLYGSGPAPIIRPRASSSPSTSADPALLATAPQGPDGRY